MAKKLKKKVEEICGLVDLDWEARQARATEILASNDWKQKLCNECIGLSFRDLESILTGVANERQKPDEEKVYKNEKLATYRNTSKRSSVSGVSSDIRKRTPTRTLAEILAQVHSPRVSSGVSEDERRQIASLRRAHLEDLLPEPTIDGSESEE